MSQTETQWANLSRTLGVSPTDEAGLRERVWSLLNEQGLVMDMNDANLFQTYYDSLGKGVTEITPTESAATASASESTSAPLQLTHVKETVVTPQGQTYVYECDVISNPIEIPVGVGAPDSPVEVCDIIEADGLNWIQRMINTAERHDRGLMRDMHRQPMPIAYAHPIARASARKEALHMISEYATKKRKGHHHAKRS